MKKSLSLICLFVFILFSFHTQSQTVTSIANGNWTNPMTWGGMPPLPGNTVVINHTVTLDTNFAYAAGSITVNASGALNGNTPMRALALYGGDLTVHGSFNIPRVALFTGTVTNNGTFTCDSLYNALAFTNTSTATINAGQFMVDVNGSLYNLGTIISSNLLNVGSFTNAGSITTNDLLNSKTFTNTSTAHIFVSHNFLNKDTLATPAVFTNDGFISVGNDWKNEDEINGYGQFCVQHNTHNAGVMNGTIDFCDLTGGGFDLNTGTVAPTITHCTLSCNVSIENGENQSDVMIYPNPSKGFLNIELSGNDISEIIISDFLGREVYKDRHEGGQISLNTSTWHSGMYFLTVNRMQAYKIIIE